jgi:hypothetical protein
VVLEAAPVGVQAAVAPVGVQAAVAPVGMPAAEKRLLR